MDGTELLIQMPGSPLAERLYVGRLDGYEGSVVALLRPEGPRILAVLLDEEAEMELSEVLGNLPDAALQTRGLGGL